LLSSINARHKCRLFVFSTCVTTFGGSCGGAKLNKGYSGEMPVCRQAGGSYGDFSWLPSPSINADSPLLSKDSGGLLVIIGIMLHYGELEKV
jgi:hypothetical protein